MPVLSARLCAYLSEELRMRTQGRTSSGETVRRFGNAARRYEKRRGNRAAVHGFDCAGSGRTTARHSRGQHEFSAVRFAVQMSVLRNAWAAQAFKWAGARCTARQRGTFAVRRARQDGAISDRAHGFARRIIIRDTPYLPPSRTNAFFNPHKRKGNATWNFFCILSGPRHSFFWS